MVPKGGWQVSRGKLKANKLDLNKIKKKKKKKSSLKYLEPAQGKIK